MTSPVPGVPIQCQDLPLTSAPRPLRPLRREGAMIFFSPAEQALQVLRSGPTPEPVLRKRPHQEVDNGSDNNKDMSTPPPMQPQTSLPSISNVTNAALRYATHKKLRPEQHDELETFLLDTGPGQQAKLFITILSLENKVDAFQSTAPPYQVSEELKTNINNYALAVLLSVNTMAYKGNIPRNHILDILKRFHFDLLVKHDYTNWEKITTSVSYALTQTQAKLKKLIKESISSNTNIFALSQLIVHTNPCRVTVQLCARVALMRAIHRECLGSENYWHHIDDRLALIRKITGGSTSKTAKAFNEILKNDQTTFGADNDYVIGDVVPDELQQRVDAVVAGTAYEE